MTISSTANRISYAGNGSTTAFSFPYLFFATDDLTVILVVDSTGVETTQTITTHYTVAGAGVAAGGTVTMVTAPATGETLVIIREEQFTQGLDLVENDPFPSDLVEQQLDTLTMLTQQLNTEVARSLRLSDGDTSGAALQIAVAADEYIKFNAAGTALETAERAATVLNGAGVPAAGTGNDGDFYIDTTGDDIYGPKAAGAWGAATSLVGPTGATGATGPAGAGDLVSTNNLSDVAVAATALSNIGGIGAATSDTLTNKTFDANGTGNSLSNVDVADLAVGTDGELITWDAAAAPTTVAAGSSGEVLTSNGAGAAPTFQAAGGGITIGSESATTSGTSVTIGSIPAGTKRITIMFENVSQSTTTDYLVTIGDAGGLETSGYISASHGIENVTTFKGGSSASFLIQVGGMIGDTGQLNGHMVLTLKDAANFTWIASFTMSNDLAQNTVWGGGSKSLSAELTQISLSGVTFDAGSIALLLE